MKERKEKRQKEKELAQEYLRYFLLEVNKRSKQSCFEILHQSGRDDLIDIYFFDNNGKFTYFNQEKTFEEFLDQKNEQQRQTQI